MNYEALGYHTCRADGSKDELRHKVPFLSRKKGQWLGQGYYFWTESDYWARKWRRKGEEIVISEFKICIEREKLLDLVGSLKDQQNCARIFRLFSSRHGNKHSASAVFSWLLDEREKPGRESIFHYWAVRAKDTPKGTTRYPFIGSQEQANEARGFEELLLMERHQMCVYPEYKDKVIAFERFVYPDHFMEGTWTGAIA